MSILIILATERILEIRVIHEMNHVFKEIQPTGKQGLSDLGTSTERGNVTDQRTLFVS